MLKEWIETGRVLSQTTVRGVESCGPLRIAGVRATCAINEIGPSMETTIAAAMEKFKQHCLPTDGRLASVYHDMSIKQRTFDYTTGCVIDESAGPVPDELSHCAIPASDALVVEHVGSYEHLGNAWSAAYQYVRYKKLKLSKVGGLEIYQDDPETTPAAELRSRIILPLR